jgi:hypothetical protein
LPAWPPTKSWNKAPSWRPPRPSLPDQLRDCGKCRAALGGRSADRSTSGVDGVTRVDGVRGRRLLDGVNTLLTAPGEDRAREAGEEDEPSLARASMIFTRLRGRYCGASPAMRSAPAALPLPSRPRTLSLRARSSTNRRSGLVAPQTQPSSLLGPSRRARRGDEPAAALGADVALRYWPLPRPSTHPRVRVPASLPKFPPQRDPEHIAEDVLVDVLGREHV